MKSLVSGFILISTICIFVQYTVAIDHKCMDKMSDDEKKAAMGHLEACKKKLGITEFPKLDDLEKNGFDDKCFAKCMLEEHKIVTDKNTIDLKGADEFMKKVPADKQAELKKLWEACGESTKKAMDAEGGINDKTICKASAMLKHCFMKGAHKVC